MQSSDESAEGANISEPERWATLLGGGALVLYSLTRRSWGGLALALLGGSLVYVGATKYCSVYEAVGINTAEEDDTLAGSEGESG